MSEVIATGHWEVTRAKNAGQKDNPHGGQFDKWYCGLKNLDGGKDCDDAYWQRKAPSEVTVGDKVYGKLEKNEYGLRFYVEKEPDGGGYEARSGSGGGSSSGEYMKPKTPQEVAEMRRSHSQEMALRLLAIRYPNGFPDGMDVEATLKARIEEFDQEVIAAGQALNSTQAAPSQQNESAAPSPASASPGSSSVPAGDQKAEEAHQLYDALDRRGVTDAGEREWLIKAWKNMASKDGLSGDERRAIALTTLTMGDTESQAGALKRLRELAGPMPTAFKTDDSDIPF